MRGTRLETGIAADSGELAGSAPPGRPGMPPDPIEGADRPDDADGPIDDVVALLGDAEHAPAAPDGEPDEGGEADAAEVPEGDDDSDAADHRVPAKSAAKVPAERTSDAVGLYMSALSSVRLLSREGEIAIAKRIEAGR